MNARLRESRQRSTSITSAVVAMLAGIVAWSTVASCNSPTEPEWLVELAWIVGERPEDEPSLSLTVHGDRVEMTIVTVAGYCDRRARVRQTIDGTQRVVLAEPLNWYRLNVACPDVLITIPHTALLGPLDPGDWTVRVRGLNLLGDTVEFDRPVEIAP